MSDFSTLAFLSRITEALERLAPKPPEPPDFNKADTFVWHAQETKLRPVTHVNAVQLNWLKGIDPSRDCLLANTQRFAQGLPANNALLWGARGMGKSSLVKAVHAAVNAPLPASQRLKLVEIQREDIQSLPTLINLIRASPNRFLLFCDDLSFQQPDAAYKALKTALEGGIEGSPTNMLFYATANQRHLLPRTLSENERADAIHPSEIVEEKTSLSDRFGLWLGFHTCSQEVYLDMVKTYCQAFNLQEPWQNIMPEALAWSTTRGARSGRTAWQFVQDLAGRLGVKI